MSTRATITVADERDSFDIYQHYDGYPDGPCGLVHHLAMARRLAWDLPRFEAADFAAAIVGILKERGGSTYLTAKAKSHYDREFHYQIEPVRRGVSTRVHLTITKPSWRSGESDIPVFAGSLQEAVQKFDAKPETRSQPRETQILADADAALCRATDEIHQWLKGTPDPDTQSTLDDIEDASRALITLREHLAKADPWGALKAVGGGKSDVLAKLALEAHARFQR